MNPSEALERQHETRDFWLNGDGSHYMHHILGKCGPHTKGAVPPPIDPELVRGARLIARLIDEAETYFVAAPICQLLEHGLATFPVETTLHEQDLVTPTGFVVFETPVRAHPSRSDGVYLHDVVAAIGWRRYVNGMNVAFFAPADRHLALIGTTNWRFGWSCRDAVDFMAHPDDGVVIFPIDMESLDDLSVRLPNFSLLLSLLLFSTQRLTATTQERPYRAVRKRVARWRAEPLVRVIALRARVYDSAAEPYSGAVAWQCRWITRGHWRNQPCGPGRSVVRPVWVASYVKGPADKPLKNPRANVFAVVR